MQLSAEQKRDFGQFSYTTLLEQLTVKLVSYFQETFKKEDKNLLFEVFRDIHLRVIDKLWIPHIDEMQYLKDKVGFMGYAQMDPLVVYKKESFEKFQDLLANIKTDTTRMLMGIDYTKVAEFKQMQEQFLAMAKDDPELIKKLQEASKQGGKVQISKSVKSPLPMSGVQDQREMIFSDEDGVEIFEVDGDKRDVVEVVSTKSKVRPNDLCPCGSGKKYKKCCGE